MHKLCFFTKWSFFPSTRSHWRMKISEINLLLYFKSSSTGLHTRKNDFGYFGYETSECFKYLGFPYNVNYIPLLNKNKLLSIVTGIDDFWNHRPSSHIYNLIWVFTLPYFCLKLYVSKVFFFKICDGTYVEGEGKIHGVKV